jgi:hypothetical protein
MLLMRMAHPRRRAWRRRSQFSALKRAIESNQVGDFGTAFKSACHTSKNTSLVRFPLQFSPTISPSMLDFDDCRPGTERLARALMLRRLRTSARRGRDAKAPAI